MPKVIPLTENERKDKAIRDSLMGRMKDEKISCERLASMLGVSLNTFYRHRDDPEKITLRERRILAQIFPDLTIE